MPFSADEDSLLGTTLQERYRIDALLGRGGMAIVYQGRDLRLDRAVAIKVLPVQDLSDESRRRLLREARAAAALNHPRIVATYDTGEFAGNSFIVMELVDGTTLRGTGPLNIPEAVDVGLQLCEALGHAHTRGVIHRDIKPENVMVTREGERIRVKLADFGLAMTSGATRLTRSNAILGTLSYLAPEQASGSDVDGRADLYALGVVLYEAIAGCLPFSSDHPLGVIFQHLHAPVVPPRIHRPEMPADLDAIIVRLLEKKPDLRYASVAEVTAALECVAQSLEIEDSRIPQDVPAERAREKVPIPLPGKHGHGWLRETRWSLRPDPSGPSQGDVAVARGVTTIGNGDAAGLMLTDDSVSPLHARLELSRGALAVFDMSPGSTRLNGIPVPRATLVNGDRLEFGRLGFTVVARTRLARGRLVVLTAALAVLFAAGFGMLTRGDRIGDRGGRPKVGGPLLEQVRRSVEMAIQAYNRGELDYARSHLLFAGDLLMLANLSPPGASLERPQELFRGLARELLPAQREFDFSRALDTGLAARHDRSLQDLSSSEYIDRQVRRFAFELGQQGDAPRGFIEQVEALVRRRAGDSTFQRVIDRSASIQGVLSDLFAEAHLPQLFSYIPWIESELVTTATSADGARGLWQFRADTGRQYGLRIDPRAGIDERIEVVNSTQAAIRYIGYLFRKFGREQFMCTLASYNRGDAAMFVALEKIPDPMMASSLKYWYLVEHDLLPVETSEYVARVFATRILAEDPERFGLRRP